MRTRIAFIIGAGAALVGTLAIPAGAGPIEPPDGFIKKAGGDYKGVGVVANNVVPAQTVVAKVAPGGTTKFTTRATNEDSAERTIRFAGPAGIGKFRLRYFVGGVDVTSDAVAGELDFEDLAPDARTSAIKIAAKVKASAIVGTVLSAPVKFYELSDPGIDDNLQFRVKVV